MKALSTILFSLISVTAFSQHKLEKLWETDTSLKVPESVLYDGQNKVLYVANIDGQPAEKDGKGSIGKVGLDGKVIAAEWIKGLNAPKGMAMHKGMLWVSDVDAMVEIDIKKGVIARRIEVEGSSFLNDVTIDPSGKVYVSDSRANKVYQLNNGKVSLYLDGLQGPNGLLFHKGKLLILDKGALIEVSADKSTRKIAEGMEGGTDGVEHVGNNEFIVSCWAGNVYYVYADGKKDHMLNTTEQKINSADIGYDAKNRIVYVPTFWKNNVVAYLLK